MTRPWTVLERVETREGALELRRRGDGDVLIAIAGRILMNSRAHRSEVALADLACRPLSQARAPRVLIGGLGMGYTLRAALDELPADARVVVAEITPAVARWCQNELADLNRFALEDPRVEVRIEDVALTVAEAGGGGPERRFDAILFDLYAGPGADTQPVGDPFYGIKMLQRVRRALRPGGVFAVWSESVCSSFEKRLRSAGYDVERSRPGRGGLRHAVYVAKPVEGYLPHPASRRGPAS